MKSKLLVMFAIFLSMAVLINAAEARRFGGGRSFGKSWSAPTHRTTSTNHFSKGAVNKPSYTKSKAGSMFKGALMGLLAGGLIGSLLSGSGFHGFQGMDFLIIAGLAFLIFRLFQSKKQQAQPYTQQNQPFYREDNPPAEQYSRSNIGSAMGNSINIPPSWFNEQKFVDGAKSHFIKLQKAWDDNDLLTIQSYCTPDLFHSIAKERAEYTGVQQTNILSLHARLLDIIEEGEFVIAGLEFEATVQSNNAPSERIREVWSIQHEKAHGHGDWLIVGIEQR